MKVENICKTAIKDCASFEEAQKKFGHIFSSMAIATCFRHGGDIAYAKTGGAEIEDMAADLIIGIFREANKKFSETGWPNKEMYCKDKACRAGFALEFVADAYDIWSSK